MRRDYRKRTHDDYVQEVAIKNTNVEVVGQYVNIKTPILHRCKKHNVVWLAFPESILRGCGCEQCGVEKRAKKQLKTHEQYVAEVKNINPNIDVIGTYIDAKTPIQHYCRLHHVLWDARPHNILNGNGCVECGKDKLRNEHTKLHEEYVAEIAIKNPTVDVIGQYVGANTPIAHYCKVHKIIWNASPTSILQGHGCWQCHIDKTREKLVLSHSEYVDRVYKINPNIEVVDKYIDSETAISHRCLVDGHIWFARPYNILIGKGCPKCNESHGEKIISLWLSSHNINYTPQYKFDDCKNIRALPFDFYLSDYNVCIEFDGEQHFRPIDYFGGIDGFNKTQQHDNIKNKYCQDNNIKLLRIPYFKNIEEELNNFLFI